MDVSILENQPYIAQNSLQGVKPNLEENIWDVGISFPSLTHDDVEWGV